MMKARPLHTLFFLLAGLVIMGGLLPFPAMAATSSDLVSGSRQLAGQLFSIPKLIAFISYVVGTALAVRALFALKGFIEKPDDVPVNIFIGFATVSALLILLPYSIGVTANTLNLQTATVSSSSTSFNANPGCTSGNDVSLNNVFCSLVTELSPFAKFLSIIAYVMAVALTLTGLLNLKAYGDDPSQMPLRSIIIKFVLATMLISLPFAMQIFITSVTGVKSIDTKVGFSSSNKPSLFKGSIRGQ